MGGSPTRPSSRPDPKSSFSIKVQAKFENLPQKSNPNLNQYVGSNLEACLDPKPHIQKRKFKSVNNFENSSHTNARMMTAMDKPESFLRNFNKDARQLQLETIHGLNSCQTSPRKASKNSSDIDQMLTDAGAPKKKAVNFTLAEPEANYNHHVQKLNNMVGRNLSKSLAEIDKWEKEPRYQKSMT